MSVILAPYAFNFSRWASTRSSSGFMPLLPIVNIGRSVATHMLAASR